jgi:hypothetical protein
MDVRSIAGPNRSRKALLAITLLTALVGVVAVSPATAQPKPLVVTFEKHLVDGTNLVFQGTTGGRAKGGLESRMVPGSLTIDGPVWRFAFDWIVDATAEHKSFVARTTGSFDTSTGADGLEVGRPARAGRLTSSRSSLLIGATCTRPRRAQTFRNGPWPPGR